MPEDNIPASTAPKNSPLEVRDRIDDHGIEIWSDQAALKILDEDTSRADAYMNLNQWAAGWAQAVILYQSPMQAGIFRNGALKASVPSYTLSDHLSAIVPKVVGGLFYEDPPFVLRPEPSVSQTTIRAKNALFSYQLREMRFREECEDLIFQMAHLGSCIAKYGWRSRTIREKQYIPGGKKVDIPTKDGNISYPTSEYDKFTIKINEKKIEEPWLKFCDIRTVLVCPGTRRGDIRTAEWVIHRQFQTFDDIDSLREQPGYDIPSREQLRNFWMRSHGTKGGTDNMTLILPEGMRGWLQSATPRSFKNSGDPLLDGVEMLERWDKHQVAVALCYNGEYILIRNEAHSNGEVPFFSANWRNIPDAFYGQGLGLLIGSEQMVEQGIRCLALDLLGYVLQPTIVRKEGFNAPTQQIVMGTQKIITVQDDVDKAYKFLEMPGIKPEVWQFLQNTAAKAQQSSGANENFTLGVASPGVRSTGARSGTGAQLVGQAQASRLDSPMERFQNQIFIPWLEKMDDLNNQFLPTQTLRDILGDKLTPEDLKAVDHIDFRSAKMRFEVLAGAHLGPKREMAQFFPFMLQLLNNPTFELMLTNAGYIFDVAAIFKAMADASGWKFSQEFMRKMTPQEQQRAQANSPAGLQAQKGQQAQQIEAQKFQQQQQEEEQNSQGRAATLIAKDIIEKSLETGDLGSGTEGYDIGE